MKSSHRVQFQGASGAQLTGLLQLPEGPPRAFVLFAHCFACGKDLRLAARMARRMAEQGLAVLRFDFTGLGESEGEFAETSFSSNLGDLRAAADYLRREHRAPEILVGHSLGGAAMLAVAADIPEAVAVATIAAPAEPAHLRTLIDAAEPELDQRGQANIDIGGRTFRIRAEFLEDLERHENAERIGALGRALLVMHSPQDAIVGIDHASRIFRAARHPRSFISLDGADHLLSHPQDAEYAAITIAAWASRYLPAQERRLAGAGAADRQGQAEDARGRVRASLGESGLAVELYAGRHRMRADEPREQGGDDTGGTPYDFLLSALGACTAMTLRMYAARKSWPLLGVEVWLDHGRIHAQDCRDCESREGRVDVIEREIEIAGPLDESQRARLLEIADKCPVHRTLENEIKIRTRVAVER